jgi:hypothetical protein
MQVPVLSIKKLLWHRVMQVPVLSIKKLLWHRVMQVPVLSIKKLLWHRVMQVPVLSPRIYCGTGSCRFQSRALEFIMAQGHAGSSPEP